MANLYIRYPSASGSSTTANQGSPAVLANAWPVKVSDGINYAAVKAASTAPQATDPALVVSISPNSSINTSNLANGLTGAAVPTTATYIGVNKAGNLTGLVMDSASNLMTAIGAIDGTIDNANSTTVTLGASGNFTGSWVQITNFASIQVGIYSDQSSATDGFKLQFSQDGTTVAHTHTYTYESTSNGTGYLFQPEFKYYRVNYTNDGVAQTTFQLISTLRTVAMFPSQYRVSQAITGESQAIATKGVIYGLTTGGGGGYVAVKVTPSGALAVDATLSALDAAVLGQETMANSLPVVLASNQSAITTTQQGSTNANAPTYNIYSSSSITTAAYTQLVASTTSAINALDIFDSSGQAMILATGGAGSETIIAYVPPGGASYRVSIPAGTRVAYKALTANATSGYLLINYWS